MKIFIFLAISLSKNYQYILIIYQYIIIIYLRSTFQFHADKMFFLSTLFNSIRSSESFNNRWVSPLHDNTIRKQCYKRMHFSIKCRVHSWCSRYKFKLLLHDRFMQFRKEICRFQKYFGYHCYFYIGFDKLLRFSNVITFDHLDIGVCDKAVHKMLDYHVH